MCSICYEKKIPDLCTVKLDLSKSFSKLLSCARELASSSGIPDRTHPDFVDLRHIVCAVAMSEEACKFLGELSPVSKEDVIKILKYWYSPDNSSGSISKLAGDMRKLRDELLSKVFGQDHAVQAIIEGLL